MTTNYDLDTVIRQQLLATQRSISFAEFMQQALYHPTLGYYSQGDIIIGKEGDFTTAPHVSPFFGACLAQIATSIIDPLGEPNILEVGAGMGQCAYDLLLAMGEQAAEVNYFIYEISPTLRDKQRALLSQLPPAIFANIHWLSQLPKDFKGFIFANEVLDALPVDRIHVGDDCIKECCVNFEKDSFIWELREPLTNATLAQAEEIRARYALDSGYSTEIHSRTPAFIETISACLKQGILLFLDYGYGEREYYHPERRQGTLTCFYRHQKNQYPLQAVGKQDITAHVNFTQVIEVAASVGCDLAGFTTQSAFLLDCGLMQIAEKSERARLDCSQEIKILTMPMEMGEVVKVMALSKGVNFKPLGFGLLDRRRDL